uniref:hypothetical protein n=1 Tax=Aeromicrobium sp. TaxID=1871063 RepID=UPI002FC91188
TWSAAYVGGGSVFGALAAMTTDTFGRASWLMLVLLALALIPVLIIRTVVGVRPVSAAPDVASLELAARRSRFSPLVSDLQH